ncbi:hypothetical protein TNCV_4147721 [Trichonephila clavipes]|nr:hypothetical protein TNCV_4147721 [Trichonephila clavipes]
MHLKVSRHLKERYQYVICLPWSVMQHFTRRTILCTTLSSRCLGQFIHFSVSARMRGVLVCLRIVSTSNLPPKSSHTHFQWGLDLENALAIRDVGYPRCLDNPEQRVFDDMLRCLP